MTSKEDEELQEVLLCNILWKPQLMMQRLKASLWFAIGKIVDEETLEIGVNATPQFIGALTEMVWSQIGTR